MSYISSRNIRIAMSLAATLLALLSFQNCGNMTSFGGVGKPQEKSGNGEGYGGKVSSFQNLASVCADLKPTAQIDKMEDGSFLLVRQNCQEIPPRKIAENLVELLAINPDNAIFENRLFTRGPSDESGPSRGEPRIRFLCRGVANTAGFPRDVTDFVIFENGPATVQIRLATLSAPGTISELRVDRDLPLQPIVISPSGVTEIRSDTSGTSEQLTAYINAQGSGPCSMAVRDLSQNVLQWGGSVHCYSY